MKPPFVRKQGESITGRRPQTFFRISLPYWERGIVIQLGNTIGCEFLLLRNPKEMIQLVIQITDPNRLAS